MANVDAFGLRLGSKVSKAASLAARPRGATMREIVNMVTCWPTYFAQPRVV
jgi:hypothetical protein